MDNPTTPPGAIRFGSKKILYMLGYRDRSEGIEQLMPWSDFIKEHCTGLIDVETVTVENHPELPL